MKKIPKIDLRQISEQDRDGDFESSCIQSYSGTSGSSSSGSDNNDPCAPQEDKGSSGCCGCACQGSSSTASNSCANASSFLHSPSGIPMKGCTLYLWDEGTQSYYVGGDSSKCG